ncbi:preprotein translocase subunit YajC [Streptomyces sp. NPDC090022]|uniref:preprotein translocase subunit YajC n=1 Tax=Streptomyces sp. NPDC090022 TaxID=3365920 RepID=UPI00380A317C
MFLMTRSAKKKQQQAVQMRDQMTPGTGVRTIGGMYATVKEVNDDTVLLEVAPGVHAVFAKNSIGAVLEDAEYNRIVHGTEPTIVPDDASSLTLDKGDDEAPKLDLGKKDESADRPADKPAGTSEAKADDETGTTEGKTDGGSGAK